MIKFCNLHGHSTFSVFDGFAYPDKHIDAAIKKGMYSLALTDHGNMNGLVYQVLHAKKLEKQDIIFKPIYGVEAYFIDSYKEWTDKYGESAEDSDGVIEDEENRRQNKNKYAHLVLLAKNQNGYNNLCKLVSASHGKSFYRKPRIDYDLLKEHSEDIVCTSACLAGPLAKIMWDNIDGEEEYFSKIEEKVKTFVEIFGSNFYLELQWNAIPEQHVINKILIEIAQKLNIKLVSTCDAHYPEREDWEAREIYKKLGWLSSGITPDWAKDLSVNKDELLYELYIKNGDEMFEEYKRYSQIAEQEYDDDIILQSIENTFEISEEIERFFPESSAKFPTFILKDGEVNSEKLSKLCNDEMVARGLDKDPIYVERLRVELETIISRNFCEYFLTMKEISDFAQNHYLTGPGRGSAAGSLIAYLLKITQVDPIKDELLFSRFLRKDAEGYPDIDYDVSDRDGLVTNLMSKWGENCVVPITNWNTLSIKSLTKDLAKLLNVDFQEVNEVTRVMDDEAVAAAKNANDIKSGVYTPTVDEYIQFSKSFSDFLEKYPQIEQYLKLLEGQIRSQSRHAGGILVVDKINEKIPLIRSKVNKEEKEKRIANNLQPYIYQTPWTEGQNVRHLEPMGFIKFDVLGLKTLSIIENTIRLILYKNKGTEPSFEDIKDFYNLKLHPDNLDKDNLDIMKSIYWEGKWAGIFQFTEEGVQKFCMEVKPKSIADLSVITAIYRPGPLGAGVVEKYLQAKNRPKKIKYDHPYVEEVTKSTYGFLIFQEQISMLAHKLGKNISQDEAELLRKVLTKKGTGKDEVKDKLKIKFVDGCIENNLSEEKAEEIWNTFELFAGYGFNKCLEENTKVEIENYGYKAIKNVNIGEKVNSKNGYVLVKDKIYNGKKKVYKIKLSNNYELECTLDHKLETTIGMKTVKEIISGNLEIICKEKEKMPKIISVEYIREKETYDLEVDHVEHTFFANDISVSNSHSACYSYISYMCAWLLHNYPDEWLASFLDHEPEASKEEANNIVRSLGYKIRNVDINISRERWIPDYQGSLVQPISSIKGIGDKALQELLQHRPFNSLKELLFHPKMSYRRVTKKIIAVLIQSEALNSIISEFDNAKHAYMIVESGKPKSEKEYNLRFENHKGIADFSNEEKIHFKTELCGIYPLREIVNNSQISKLRDLGVCGISDFKGGHKKPCWGVSKKIEHKKTSTGKNYAVLTFIDSSYKETNVKCWSWNFDFEFSLNCLYIMTLEYDTKWGYSSRSYRHNFKQVTKKGDE